MRVLAMVMLIACTREAAEPERQAPAPAPAVTPIPVATPVPKPMPPLSPKAQTLAASTEFSIDPYGFEGDTHPAELATRALAAEPDAIETFEALSQHPNRVARLYAYWALRSLAPERAAAQRPELANDPTPVTMFVGCIGEIKPTADTLAHIEQRSL